MRTVKPDWKPFSTLYGFVRLILLVDWDPIGIFGYPGAMDEYDSYVGEIEKMLLIGTTREALVAHLGRIEKESMGLQGERYADGQAQVAEKLLIVSRCIAENEATWPMDTL